jgi:hypothetical protein
MLPQYEEPKYAKTAGTAPDFGTAASHAIRIDPLYLFARSVQWRHACHDDAFRELSRAQMSSDPTTRCIAKSLLKRCGFENTNGQNQE